MKGVINFEDEDVKVFTKSNEWLYTCSFNGDTKDLDWLQAPNLYKFAGERLIPKLQNDIH